MEFVKVLFPTSRRVNVDSAPQSFTGDVILVQAGIHRFDLGTPKDYTPPTRKLPVSGTTFSTPLEIEFTPAVFGVASAPHRPAPPRATARARSAAKKNAKRPKKLPARKTAKTGATKSKGGGRRTRRGS